MTTLSITRQKVIDLIDTLPTDSLPEVAQFVEYLRFKSSRSPASPPSEQLLLSVINRRLPEKDQQRLTTLRENNGFGRLSDSERAELLAYVERVEHEDAERAEALIELARLRGVSLSSLLSQFSEPTNVI